MECYQYDCFRSNRWTFAVGAMYAEQVLSSHSEVVPSLEGLKQNNFRMIEDFVTLTARSWFHNLATGIEPNYM